MTLRTLRRMSERELRIWMRFASVRGFPARRAEVQAAQIALVIAKAWGGNKGLTLNTFLLEKMPPKPGADDDDDAAGEVALDDLVGGFAVRKLGQGRKRK